MSQRFRIAGATAADIVASVETAVHNGLLAPGDLLPPVRALAADLGVATATAATAYRTLRRRGIVDTAGRNGTRVRHRPALLHHAAALPPDVVDLAGGEPDPALLPDLAVALTRIPTTPSGYRDAGNCPDLLDAARERFRRDGLTGALMVTGGALDGIERALTSHLAPGDTVAVEDPCWANLKDLVAALGMHVHPIPVDDEGPTPDGLRRALSAARAVVVTSRAHNPTGASVTAARAERLRPLLADAAPLVIEDDHWAELADEPLHPVADAAPRWLFLRSTSKPYGPDLRLAVATGDDDTVARVAGRMRIGTGWVSTVLQHVVLGLWDDPETRTTLRTATDAYRARRERLLAALADRGVAATGHTGLNVWVPVSDETHAVTVLRDGGYAATPGHHYRIASPPGIRLSLGALPVGAVDDLADVVAASVRRPPPSA